MEKLSYFVGYCYGRCKRFFSSPFFIDTMMVAVAVVAIVIILTTAARAEEAKCEVVLGGWSYHQDRERKYNETHSTIGLECNDWVLMTYNNSLGNRSIFAGRSTESSKSGLSYGIQYGLINGYNHGSSSPFPIILPKVSYNAVWGGVDVIVIPKVVTYANLKFHLQDYTPIKRGKPTPWATAVGYGTTGRFISVSRRLSPIFDAEFMVSRDSLEIEKEGIRINRSYSIDADFTTLRANYYPWGGDFKLVAGLARNKSSAAALYSVNPNRENLTGAARVEAEFDSFSPYLGIGWGNPWVDDRKLSMSIDLGAYKISGAKFKGSVNSPTVQELGLQRVADALVTLEAARLEKKFSDVDLWWNIAVSVRYRF